MKFRELKHLPVVALVAVGLALAGCGGGGTSKSELNAANAAAAAQAAEAKRLQGEINALRAALGLEPEEGDPAASIQGLKDQIAALQKRIDDAKKADDDKAADDARKAMMATAMKLHAGIVARNTGDGAGKRDAAYAGTNDSEIAVSIGEAAAVNLKAGKTTVADHHGWKGKMYADPAGGDTYEAVVYSNVGKATEGKKFASTAAVTDGGAYQYQLNTTEVGGANTELNVTGVEGYAARVASSSFDQSAGKKEFKKGENLTRVVIAGSFHGVSGNYYCTPTTGETCSASKADKGYTLANGTWTFKASNNEARVMSVADSAYASYGWWVKKDADGKKVTASAFTDNKGTPPTALNTEAMAALRGTATYMGGAAGKYALYSTTGGINDAGHFTARAMLEATFAVDHKVSGTIDNFMGADGKSRDWSVKLNEAGMNDSGAIAGSANGLEVTTENAHVGTVWTIDGTAAAKSGQWMGNLQEAGKDGVPAVATGTFYSHYGNDGRMVGAFGANKQ